MPIHLSLGSFGTPELLASIDPTARKVTVRERPSAAPVGRIFAVNMPSGVIILLASRSSTRLSLVAANSMLQSQR
jgi:hypothetical protein